jgi:hypothetical protein
MHHPPCSWLEWQQQVSSSAYWNCTGVSCLLNPPHSRAVSSHDVRPTSRRQPTVALDATKHKISPPLKTFHIFRRIPVTIALFVIVNNIIPGPIY